MHFSCAALAADANSQGSIEAGNGEVGFGNPHWECNFLKETWDTRARGDVSQIALGNFSVEVGNYGAGAGRSKFIEKMNISTVQLLPRMQIPKGHTVWEFKILNAESGGGGRGGGYHRGHAVHCM